MSDNVITSENVAPKKAKQSKTKKVEQKILPDVEKIVVYFESGYAYSLPNGFTFTQDNKMLELPADEAKRLLTLNNFRLPNDEEKQLYYNSVEE